MVVESVEIVITREQANAYFDEVCQLRRPDGKPLNQRQVGDLLDVDQSTVSRNKRDRKAGKDISDELFEVIAAIAREQQLEKLRQKHLEEQREAEKTAEAQLQSETEAAQKEFEAKQQDDEEKERQQELAREAEENRRSGVHKRLQRYWTKMQATGMLQGVDPATQGDAPELLAKAQPSDIEYPTLALAAIALAPANQRFACGLTAAQLRQGITAWQRLKGKYSKRTRKDELVPPILRPDADLYYGDNYEELLTWQRMNAEQSALALEPLPLTVSPEAAEKFHEFVTLDRELRDRGYKFEGSRLDACGDVETRLRDINERTILPIAGAGALKGLKWMGIAVGVIAAAAAALGAVLLIGWGAWELGSWVVDMAVAGVKAAINWLDEMKWHIGGVTATGAALAAALWWAWPKESDQRNYRGENIVAWRFFTVGALIFFVALAAVIFAYAAVQIDANQADIDNLARAVSEGIYNPRIITP